jgi:O-antigen ligase
MFINGNLHDILQWGYQSLMFANLMLIFDLAKNKKKELTLTIAGLGIVLLLINYVTLITFPRGIIRSTFYDSIDNDWYFLGIKTQFTTMMFPTIAAALYYYFENNIERKKAKFVLISAIAACLVNILHKNISTALMGMLIIVIMIMISKLCKVRYHYFRGFFIAIALSVLFVFFNIQQHFAFLIINVLGKDITLSSRVFIWSTAKSIIFKSSILQVLFGHGQTERFVPVSNALWSSHNELLSLLYNGGIIGTIGFYGYINRLGRCKNTTKSCQYLTIICFVLMIMTITENYFDVAVVYTPFLLLHYVGRDSYE